MGYFKSTIKTWGPQYPWDSNVFAHWQTAQTIAHFLQNADLLLAAMQELPSRLLHIPVLCVFFLKRKILYLFTNIDFTS